MSTRIISIIVLLLWLSGFSFVRAENPYEFILTNNKEIEAKMLFLDKLTVCENHKYHAEPGGIYEIYGKANNACHLKWTLADCNFPEGVYQEFARVQKHRTIERLLRLEVGLRNEFKDKNYRYLLQTGNKYCSVSY